MTGRCRCPRAERGMVAGDHRIVESSVFFVPRKSCSFRWGWPPGARLPVRRHLGTVGVRPRRNLGWYLGYYAYELIARPILEFYGSLERFEALRTSSSRDAILLMFDHVRPGAPAAHEGGDRPVRCRISQSVAVHRIGDCGAGSPLRGVCLASTAYGDRSATSLKSGSGSCGRRCRDRYLVVTSSSGLSALMRPRRDRAGRCRRSGHPWAQASLNLIFRPPPKMPIVAARSGTRQSSMGQRRHGDSMSGVSATVLAAEEGRDRVRGQAFCARRALCAPSGMRLRRGASPPPAEPPPTAAPPSFLDALGRCLMIPRPRLTGRSRAPRTLSGAARARRMRA